MDKSLDKYKLDILDITTITNEDTAIAVLLELEPKYFIDFISLSPKIRKGEIAYDTLSAEQQSFLKEYREFLESFRPNFMDYKERDYEKIKEKALWNEDFCQFVQSIYNEGVIFSDSVIKKLAKNKITPTYNNDSWLVRLYHNYKNTQYWSYDDALYLFMGVNPNDEFYTVIDTRQASTIRFFSNAREYIETYKEANVGQYYHIYEKFISDVERGVINNTCVKKTNLEKSNDDCYDCIDITKWFIKNTLYEPVPIMLEILGIREQQIKSEYPKNIRATKNEIKEVFSQLQKEQQNKVPRFKRDDEEKEMIKRLQPKTLDRPYHRELRAELKLKKGRPIKIKTN